MISTNLSKIYTVIIFCFCTMFTIGQERYTPYDKVPGVPIMYKPAYTPTYPDWAKMLYQYPVDYHAICDKFDSYMLKNKGSKSAIIRYFKLWRPAIAPFVSTDGNIELPDFKALNNKIDNKSSKSGIVQKSSIVDNSNWTFWGPKCTVWRNTGANLNAGDDAPWQVNIYSMDVSASNNDILYAGSETGFLNKSIDNGFTWDLIAKDYKFGGAIGAIVIHPTNPDIVYVSNSAGVHKTINGGITWQKMSSFDGHALEIDPNNPQKIIVASFTGVYLSNDAGVNWTKTHASSVWDVKFKPDDSNVVYAISIKNNTYFDLIVSTDGGASFTSDVNFPVNLEEKNGAVLAVTPANPDVVYLAMLSGDAASGTNFPLVYKAQALLSGGRVWTEQIKGAIRTGGGGFGLFSSGQGFYDLILGVDPDDEDVLFFGTTAFFKSTNSGLDWTKLGGYGGNFNVHPDMQAIKMLGNGKIWLATDGGINFSSDNFTNVDNWRVSIQGLHGSQMWGFDQGWNEDVIVGGRYHNGNVALKDIYNDKALRMGGGESPTGWIIHGKPGQATFKDINKNYTTSIPETIDHVVANKKYAFTKLPNMKGSKRRGNLLHHPNYSETLYTGEGTGVWKSTDMGATWNLLNNFSGDVMFIEISHKNPEVMYADVEGFGLYKTEDGGLNWVMKNSFIGSGLGTSSWVGYLHFVISPYDENTIYLCPQKTNADWEGKILKSTNGGDTWVNWSGTLPTSQYTKVLAIQPTSSGEDLVYIFNNAVRNVASAIGESFFRKENATDWEPFNNNYLKELRLIYAKPFYRDGKIRVAGSDGVWESPLAEPIFTPEVNAWVEKTIYACAKDTIRIADHSMLNHSGATWNWIVTPAPEYISDATSKSPKIVVGASGNYTVQQEVTQGGVTYTKTHTDMFSVEACATSNCDTPGLLDQLFWSLLFVDSESNDGQPGELAFDGNPSSKWNSGFEPEKPDYPHEIRIDLGDRYKISEFLLTSHTQPNGRIKDAEIYISDDVNNWGQPVLVTFQNQASQDPVVFSQPISGRYLRVVGLNSTDGDKFATINEINLIGCDAEALSINDNNIINLKAFPIPTSGHINISIPGRGNFDYEIHSLLGQVVKKGIIKEAHSSHIFDLGSFESGMYIINLIDETGAVYRAKVIKN